MCSAVYDNDAMTALMVWPCHIGWLQIGSCSEPIERPKYHPTRFCKCKPLCDDGELASSSSLSFPIRKEKSGIGRIRVD